MSETESGPPQLASARPELTAALMARIGLDGKVLTELMLRFYVRARSDAMLGPVFAARISEGERLLEMRMAVAHAPRRDPNAVSSLN